MDIYRMGNDIRKHPGLYKIFAAEDASVGFLDPKEHKARRDLLNPMFQRKEILQLEHVVQDMVSRSVAALPHPTSSHLLYRFADRYTSFSFEILFWNFQGCEHALRLPRSHNRHHLRLLLRKVHRLS